MVSIVQGFLQIVHQKATKKHCQYLAEVGAVANYPQIFGIVDSFLPPISRNYIGGHANECSIGDSTACTKNESSSKSEFKSAGADNERYSKASYYSSQEPNYPVAQTLVYEKTWIEVLISHRA